MKISKIIFISLLSVIAILIIISTLYTRMNGFHKDDLSRLNSIKNSLSEFKVLYINNCNNVNIESADTSAITATFPKDSTISKDFYRIKGDTLILSNIKKIADIKIFASKNLSCLNLKASDVTLSSATSPRILVLMDKSHLYINADKKDHSILKTLLVNAKNYSRINSNIFKIDSLKMDIQKSESNLSIHSKIVNLTLSDSSRVYGSRFESLTVKKDTTSFFYNYY